MPRFWNFLRDSDNRGALTVIVSCVATAVGAGWVFYTHEPISRARSEQRPASLSETPVPRESGTKSKEPVQSTEPEYRQPSSSVDTECNSPSDFVQRVYSPDGRTIEYVLKLNPAWAEVRVAFYGKRGVVLRTNTYVSLDKPVGSFVVPERAMIKPEQKWFNFVASLPIGCEQWGLVTEEALQVDGNRIEIGDPSGEGHAFVIINTPAAPARVSKPGDATGEAKPAKPGGALAKREIQRRSDSSSVPSQSAPPSTTTQDDFLKEGAPVRIPVTNHEKVD